MTKYGRAFGQTRPACRPNLRTERPNLRIDDHRNMCYGGAIKNKEARCSVERKPTTEHIAAMVDKLEEDSLRAVYMIVKQVYELQKALRKE